MEQNNPYSYKRSAMATRLFVRLQLKRTSMHKVSCAIWSISRFHRFSSSPIEEQD